MHRATLSVCTAANWRAQKPEATHNEKQQESVPTNIKSQRQSTEKASEHPLRPSHHNNIVPLIKLSTPLPTQQPAGSSKGNGGALKLADAEPGFADDDLLSQIIPGLLNASG